MSNEEQQNIHQCSYGLATFLFGIKSKSAKINKLHHRPEKQMCRWLCVHISHTHFLAVLSFFFSEISQPTSIFTKKKRTLQRLKRGVLPKNPTSVADILSALIDKAVLDTYGKTIHENENHKFYNGAVETSKYSFCVFSSPKTAQLMQQHIPTAERDILMDATFRIVPVGPFKQLLILYIRYNNKVFTYIITYIYIGFVRIYCCCCFS